MFYTALYMDTNVKINVIFILATFGSIDTHYMFMFLRIVPSGVADIINGLAKA